MRISDWSSDVCSSDLTVETAFTALRGAENPANVFALGGLLAQEQPHIRPSDSRGSWSCWDRACRAPPRAAANKRHAAATAFTGWKGLCGDGEWPEVCGSGERSEEHTSELQSLMRISYAVFC